MKLELVNKNINHKNIHFCQNSWTSYITHEMQVFCDIVVGETQLRIEYRNCGGYKFNDINLLDGDTFYINSPDALFELHTETWAADFEDEDDYTREKMKDLLADVQALIPDVKSMEDLFDLYQFLNDCEPTLSNVLPEPHTCNIEDYEEKENGEWLRAVGREIEL